MQFALLVTESLPDHMRGFVSRFLQRVGVGVYVGTLNARVADALWQSLCDAGAGNAVLVVSAPGTDQGYSLRTFGLRTVSIVNFDGLAMPVATTSGLPKRE